MYLWGRQSLNEWEFSNVMNDIWGDGGGRVGRLGGPKSPEDTVSIMEVVNPIMYP